MLPLVFARLVHHGPLPLALTPTLFLVLGPLGQSTTARRPASRMWPRARRAPYAARASAAFAVLYGVPVMGFALLWLALAGRDGGAAPRARHAVRDDLVGVHLPGRHLCHGRGGPGRAHRPGAFDWLAAGLFALLVTAVAGAARTAPAWPRPLLHAPAGHGGVALPATAPRPAPCQYGGRSASEGPYQVRCRPLTSAAGRPGNASGPSSAVKR